MKAEVVGISDRRLQSAIVSHVERHRLGHAMNCKIASHFAGRRTASNERRRLECGGWEFGRVENGRPHELAQYFTAHDVGAARINRDGNRTLLGCAGVEIEGTGNLLKSTVIVGEPKMGNGENDLRVMRFDLIGAGGSTFRIRRNIGS